MLLFSVIITDWLMADRVKIRYGDIKPCQQAAEAL